MLRRHSDPSCPDLTWWPDHTLIPFTDAACHSILNHALTCLILFRGGDPRDPGAVISTLASLRAETDARLPDAVTDARDQGYSWSRVADRLASTIPAVRHRYADYVRWRRLDPFD
jgi:hypothetical protein